MRDREFTVRFSRPVNWWALAGIFGWLYLANWVISQLWALGAGIVALLTWIAIYTDRPEVWLRAMGSHLTVGLGATPLFETTTNLLEDFSVSVNHMNGRDVSRFTFMYEDRESVSYDFEELAGRRLSRAQFQKLHNFLLEQGGGSVGVEDVKDEHA